LGAGALWALSPEWAFAGSTIVSVLAMSVFVVLKPRT